MQQEISGTAQSTFDRTRFDAAAVTAVAAPPIEDRHRYRRILRFFAGMIGHLILVDILLGRLPWIDQRVQASRPARLRQMARRFRALAVEMGGVLIKLGQFLSARVDVLPVEITAELAGLQDEVPSVPFPAIAAVLQQELGGIAPHFVDFEQTPLAAASLGQAHRARLRVGAPAVTNGVHVTTDSSATLNVVVKVQRPGIEAVVRTDLAALRVVARWVMRYKPIRRRANVPLLMEEFARTLWEELDYRAEAANAERFAKLFAGEVDVAVPTVYHAHSTGRVLTLENVEGIRIDNVAAMQAAGIAPTAVAERLLDIYFKQVFQEGFFHADPHPGNIFVRPRLQKDRRAEGQRGRGQRAEGQRAEGRGAEGRGAEDRRAEGQRAEGRGAEGQRTEGRGAEGRGAEGRGAEGQRTEGRGAEDRGAEGQRTDMPTPFQITFIDFGMMGNIQALMGENLRRVLLAVAKRDARTLTQIYQDMGFFLPGADLERITEAQEAVLGRIWGRSLQEMARPSREEIQELGSQFKDLLREFPFQVPQDFIYLGRAVGMLSGLTSQLHPDVNLWTQMEKYALEIVGKEGFKLFSPDLLLGEARALLAVPAQVRRLLQLAEAGQLQVRTIEDTGAARRLARLERRVNRLNYTVIASATLLAGTLLYNSDSTFIAFCFWGIAGVLFVVSALDI